LIPWSFSFELKLAMMTVAFKDSFSFGVYLYF